MTITATVFDTNLGWIGTTWRANRLDRLTFGHPSRNKARDELGYTPSHRGSWSRQQASFADQIQAYSQGIETDFSNVLIARDTWSDFQRDVRLACREIGWGETCSYAQLAQIVGRPGAARAVGTVMARNPVPLIIPCHRVIPSGQQRLGHFSAPGGVRMKQRLLALEGASIATVANHAALLS